MMINIHLILLSFFLIKISHCEFYTAQVELNTLLKTHSVVTQYFEDYLRKEEEKLENIRQKILQFKSLKKKINKKSISSPINSFRIIKSLTKDLEDILQTFSENERKRNVLQNPVKFLELKFPSIEDLSGAAFALGRLQEAYDLKVASMADGFLNEHCCAEKLDFNDCYYIGMEHYNVSNFHQAFHWLDQAFLKYQNDKKLQNKEVISQLLGHLNKIEDLFEEHFYKQDIGKFKTLEEKYERISKVTNKDYRNLIFDAACLEKDATSYKNPKLKCKYTHNNKPHLLIGPFKEEMMNFDPKISIFHEVIYQSEIDSILEFVFPVLIRTTVFAKNVSSKVSLSRISKGSWISQNDLPKVKKISKRIEDFTGLNLETSEILNVVNYGLAGQYTLHTDYMEIGHDESFKEEGIGNRIATVLIYLSDIKAGGGTVFPSLDVYIEPRKGSAAFWYNMHDDGFPDDRTLHGGCPVLIGSKWITNKWIHEAGNEFLRPCTIKKSPN